MRTLGSREVYRNAWLSVREDDVQRDDGSVGIYGVVDRQDFALVVPAERDGFWLVEQYRYPVRRRSWEFPQGTWGAGATGTPEELAAAELREETGLRAESLRHLGHFHEAYGMSSQGFDVYLATGLTPGEPERDPTEQDMRHAFFPEAELLGLIARGKMVDACTLAAYALVQIDRSRR